MTPHMAEARKAAVHILWAACAGNPLDEATAIMKIASNLWPDPPLMVGKNSPLADSPSALGWERAALALAAAKEAQGKALGIDWEQREQAERIVANAIAQQSTLTDKAVRDE